MDSEIKYLKLKCLRLGAAYLLQVLLLILLTGGYASLSLASDLGLSEADCRCCHGTTLADRHHLLVNTDGRECLSCHPLTLNPETLSYDLTVTRDCPQCHTGSLADRHHLLVDQVTYDCFTCHAIVWDPIALQYVADFNKTCQSTTPTPPSGTITGNVTDQMGAGIGWVSIATADGTYSTLATATGSYELTNVSPGSHTLVATLDGYKGSSQSVEVVDGQTLSINFTLSLLPVPATVRGVVRDTNQTIVTGASIASVDGIHVTESTADGSYFLDNIAEGNLELIANKLGYSQVSQTLNVSAGQAITQDFVLPPSVEICSDGIDNDSNGLIDCADPACLGNNSCPTPAVEICDDNIDNDANTLTDCDDPACVGSGSCESPVVEICNDGTDNNGDGLLDCRDPLCYSAVYCLSEQCNDGIDNNADGLIDCSDPDCTDTSACVSPPVEICDDGIDNDNNGLLDCADAKCADLDVCVPPVEAELCNNGVDDNGDGFIDCADVQCRLRAICLDEICDNGLDDDADNRIDCEDKECASFPACLTYSGGNSLNFTVTAKRERPNFRAEFIGDKDLSTRWWVNNTRRKWLRLDLGGVYPIDRVDIHWHSLYAIKYKIRVSRNGNYWRTVKVITDGDGKLDSNAFASTKARFVLLKLITPASTGYSIKEVEVFRTPKAAQ